MLAISRHVSRLSGYAPALPTPFRDDEGIDFAAFENLCELQIKHGATALVVCGTTGESPTLSSREQRELVGNAVKTARGRVPVIAGAGSNSTAHAVELTRDAEAAGADAVLSVVPYYNKPTQIGLYEHFRAIVVSTGLPVILYDAPSRTVCALSDETIARLAENPQIIGLKDATGDITRLARLTPLVGPQFRLLAGDDATAPAFLALGGHGCISVTSNVIPSLGNLGPSSIDSHNLTGDPACMIACEEKRRGRDIVGCPQAPHMNTLDQPRLAFDAVALPLTLRRGI